MGTQNDSQILPFKEKISNSLSTNFVLKKLKRDISSIAATGQQSPNKSIADITINQGSMMSSQLNSTFLEQPSLV